MIPLKELIRQSRIAYAAHWALFRFQNPRLVAESTHFWQTTRNSLAGRPGWVIGNGPSLRVEDLDRLKNQVCLASNKIYLAFERTAWRPAYYTCADKLVWEKVQPALPGLFPLVLGLSTLPLPTVDFPYRIARMVGGHRSAREAFSTDCGNGVYGGRTVTFFNLQIAAHLGLNPIYLLGCDHYYAGEAGAAKAGEVVQHATASNHFVPNYRQPGEKVNSAPIEEMNGAFAVARRVAETRGIKILNATRGGHLEAFERARFDDVAPAPGH